MGRTYSCWMWNCRCITWPVGFKRLIQFTFNHVFNIKFTRYIPFHPLYPFDLFFSNFTMKLIFTNFSSLLCVPDTPSASLMLLPSFSYCTLKSTNYEASRYAVFSSFLLLPVTYFHLLKATRLACTIVPIVLCNTVHYTMRLMMND